jgi:HEAT repeat protein
MLMELKKLAGDFSAQPLSKGREMRELLEHAPDDFCTAAIEVLAGDDSERVKRYLVALLWTNNLLIPCLTDPSTPQNMAEAIAKLARRVDPQLPAKLVGFVLDRTDVEPPECLERILVLLRSMPDSAGFRPLLTPLLRHPNPRIRSKVALLAGEGNRNRTWFERRMLEDDPRMRANAIESAGQAATEDLRPLFRAAALDSNNRVVGNALIALYRLGDAMAVGNLYDLVSRPDPAFRATGVWAMGETGDTRFLPVLARILTDPNETIKAATFRAIRKLRGRDNSTGVPLSVRVLADPILTDRELKIAFGVADGNKPVNGVPATQIRILVNGDHVYKYAIQEQESPRRMSVAFLLSRAANCPSELRESQREAMERCFEQRRGADGWMIAHHAGAGASSGVRQEVLFGVRLESMDSAHVRPVASLTELRNALEPRDSAKRLDFATAFLALCQELRPSRLSAHLFLVAPDSAGCTDTASLARAAQEARVSVHAICGGPADGFREMCESTGGFFSTASDIPGAVCATYRGLSHRYMANLTVDGDVKRVQVAVRSPGCFGDSPVIESIREVGKFC